MNCKTVLSQIYTRGNFKLKFFSLRNGGVSNVIKRVLTEHLSYLTKEALYELAQAVIITEKKHIEGIIIETGCALGGSSLVVASAKRKERDFFIYDVFDLIPPPSDKDGEDVYQRYRVIKSGRSEGLGGKPYHGYEKNLYAKVLQSFGDFGLEVNKNNIYLVKGLYKDTLKINSPVALAHIDCDWYDSVMICLNQIEPHLVSSGILVIDDYYVWSGCKRAVDEYFENKGKDKYVFLKKNRLHIVKK